MHTLIVLIGPTGVGKTELSLRLAEHFHTCIVSADSRQLYADLKIGTAAPTPEQLQRVQHHFVGTLKLTDYYSAAQYEAEVMKLLEDLFTKHNTVLLTGGSMMYVDAVCKGIDDIPTVDADTRQLMLHKYETEGLERLCAELKLLDPEYYKIVDLKNPKRVVHALEICYMTGKAFPEFKVKDTEGQEWSKADVTGRPMVLNFWYTGCGPCIREMSELNKWIEVYPDVTYLATTFDSAVQIKKIVESRPFLFTQIADDLFFFETFHVSGMPVTILVDKKGIIRHIEQGTGTAKLRYMQDKLQKLVSE